jgi:hypothetical protein
MIRRIRQRATYANVSTVAIRADPGVVRTFAANGTPAEQPFHLMLAC